MIPVYKPWLTDLEKSYITEAVDSEWISSTGKYVQKAEELFANFIGVKHAIVTTSGTTALHLCLRAANVDGPVVIPDITFAATAFACSYENLDILIAGVDPDTWNIDLLDVEYYAKTKGIKAVIPVHLYGNPADMDRLNALADEYEFTVIEDACESLGATIGGKKTGALGDINCFSFYGNKTFTSGEGGVVVTDNDEYAERARLLRGQAQDPKKRYWHVDVGHNYRMTNLQAAILCGQLERADEILAEKKRVSDRYLKNLKDVEGLKFQHIMDGHEHSYWLVSALLEERKNVEFSSWMRERGVDTRKVFYPLSWMPPYKIEIEDAIARKLSEQGISFPSYPQLTNAEIDKICDLTKEYLSQSRS